MLIDGGGGGKSSLNGRTTRIVRVAVRSSGKWTLRVGRQTTLAIRVDRLAGVLVTAADGRPVGATFASRCRTAGAPTEMTVAANRARLSAP